jgi:uncharacterized protein GlcG (DUF336 family)
MNIANIMNAGMQTLQYANGKRLAVCITVTDEGGHIVYQARMDDANYMTNEVSRLKAKTAFLFKCPTHVLRTITEKEPVLLQAIGQVPGDACLLEGGLPLKWHEKIVGGVGVSGGNFEQDLLVANAFAGFFDASNQEEEH